MIAFDTRSGSKYEVDPEGKRIRRLSGTRPARRGVDGEWQAFENISPIQAGSAVIVMWPNARMGRDEASMITSHVTRIAAREASS